MENQTSPNRSWSNSFVDPYQTFTVRYALGILHSLGHIFDNQYITNESLQTMMITLANRDDNYFYKLTLNAYQCFQKKMNYSIEQFFLTKMNWNTIHSICSN